MKFFWKEECKNEFCCSRNDDRYDWLCCYFVCRRIYVRKMRGFKCYVFNFFGVSLSVNDYYIDFHWNIWSKRR